MKVDLANLSKQAGFVKQARFACREALNAMQDCFCAMRIAVTVKGHCEGEARGNPGRAV